MRRRSGLLPTCGTALGHQYFHSSDEFPYQCFALLHILLLEQKLTIEVGNVDSVQIQQRNLAKTR